jgi:hypothetical protein
VRYAAASDTLVYELPGHEILHLNRETDKSRRELLDALDGATNYQDVFRRMGSFMESFTNAYNATNLNPNTANQ